jgi:post-segregation antitoxin (ccd killing protein)
MRMARVNITIPDELLEHARAAGLNVSRLAAVALAEELDRRAKIAALDAYLAELEAELGPTPQAELEAAATWADRLTSRPAPKRSAGARKATSA